MHSTGSFFMPFSTATAVPPGKSPIFWECTFSKVKINYDDINTIIAAYNELKMTLYSNGQFIADSGRWAGPADADGNQEQLGQLVQGICYYNAERYFSL